MNFPTFEVLKFVWMFFLQKSSHSNTGSHFFIHLNCLTYIKDARQNILALKCMNL